MDIHPENKGGLVSYDERFDDYSLNVNVDIQQAISHCPWCGLKLPLSQREEWFDKLEAMGVDPYQDPIPEAFTTGDWRSI